jgi:hypothetical protein
MLPMNDTAQTVDKKTHLVVKLSIIYLYIFLKT